MFANDTSTNPAPVPADELLGGEQIRYGTHTLEVVAVHQHEPRLLRVEVLEAGEARTIFVPPSMALEIVRDTIPTATWFGQPHRPASVALLEVVCDADARTAGRSDARHGASRIVTGLVAHCSRCGGRITVEGCCCAAGPTF